MTRSLFDWKAPSGVSIEQSFSTYQDGIQTRYANHFTASCDTCGARSTSRASRADAIDELDGHACTPALPILEETLCPG